MLAYSNFGNIMLALCDCNSFYVSCETVFNPELQGQPVIVLSNNDGCVVSRSPQAKAIGIRIGEPVFKIRHLIQRHNIRVFSSNYALYGDLSQRVITTLETFTPELEMYSIDEAFLNLAGFRHLDLSKYSQQIRRTVLKWTGIPISIGIAPTKTLAKIAGDIAKNSPSGVFILPAQPDNILAEFPIGDIWGIGRNHLRSLQADGITSALQLRDVNLGWVRKKYSVVMQRLVLELRGKPCFALELNPSSPKSITVSRSFGRPITIASELREAIATYASRAAEKLRLNGLTADAVQVFAKTNRFRKDYYSEAVTLTLSRSSDRTDELMHCALRGCDRIFRADQQFKKAGVILLGLRPKLQRQISLWEPEKEGSDALMQTLDAINARFGSLTIQYAVAGVKKPWTMRSDMRSPRYTSVWSEIPMVKA
jgi:DNA polymerase V